MKLANLHEARLYGTNYYAARWCDDNGDCTGFIGPTSARPGEYEVFGHTNDMFKPDFQRFDDVEYGYVYVSRSLEDVRGEYNGIFITQIETLDQTREKFGQLLAKGKDFKYYS